MTTDVIYPLLIAAGCVVIVVVVHLLTRPRPSRADIRIPTAGGATGEGAPTRRQLEQWHRDHEAAVLDYLDMHDPAPGWAGDADAIGARFESSVDAHPAPEMRAELAALRAAADATDAAAARDDTTAAMRHRDLYVSYRSSWVDRLRQFPVDEFRVRTTAGRRIGQLDHHEGTDDTEG